jgi:hypothetical protein
MVLFISIIDKHLRIFYAARLWVTGLLFFSAIISYCQVNAGNEFLQYTSPLNGSALVTRESSITIRYSQPLLEESVSDSAIIVTGSVRGQYRGELRLCRDKKTLVFDHPDAFEAAERITVKVADGLYTAGMEMIPGFTFSFQVTDNRITSSSSEWPDESYSRLKSANSGFPSIYSLRNDNPSAGFYFLEKNYAGYCYIIIMDNYGTPLFYRVLNYNAHNFTLQPAGYLSYFVEGDRNFAVLDSQYNHIATYSMKNGYKADSHDFILSENGHAFMMAYDHQLLGMDTVIEGGDPDATVVGLVIQELDEDRNVIFQWRSWDHFNILDTDESTVDLYSQYVDYVHGNSLDIDSDTSLLLCSKNLNEVTKINRLTGEIIWRLGGKHNQFDFINDERGFSMQHSAKKLDNGSLILFDNGKMSESEYSRGIEYMLDEENFTVTLINEYKHDSDILVPLMGHIQRLPDGSTVIGWGKNLGNYVCSEFSPAGIMTNDIYTDDNVKSYRVYKFDWDPGIIELDRDTLIFNTVKPYMTGTKEIKIFNRTGNNIIINGYSKGNSPFYTATTFPIVVQPYDSRILQIKFIPLQSGEYEDVMTIHSDGLSAGGETQRIAVQFAIKGTSSWDASPVKGILSDPKKDLYLYPNPVTDRLTIHYPINIAYLTVKDLQGRVLVSEEIRHSGQAEIDCSALSPGIYMLELTDGSGSRHPARFIKK